MADLATLGLAIDSRPAIDAANALDKMGEAAARGEGRVKQILTAADSLVAALNRNTAATAALTGRMDQMQVSGARAADAIKVVGVTASTAEAAVTDLAQGLEKTGAAATTSGRALDAAATSAQKHVAVTSQAAAATIKATVAHNDNAKAAGLSANELRNLSFQINDITTMALSGASAFQIMATQGGQIFQIAQSSTGGVRGLFEQAGSAAQSAASRIGLVGGALGALAVGLATATAAAIVYNAQQKELERSTFGVGRASGATIQTLNDAAFAGASGGTLSVSAARDVVGQLNSTGKIDPAVYGAVAGNMRDLAKLMGVEIPEASETVAQALSGGVAGFDKLNASLGLGGATMREEIKTLYESGRAYEAQRIIVEAYTKRVQEFAQQGVVGRFLNRFDFGRNSSDELAGIGRFVSGIFTGGTQEEQLAAARKRMSGLEYNRDAGIGYSPIEMAATAAEVAKLEASISNTAKQSKEAKTALVSLTVQPLVDSLNPAQKKIDDLRATASAIDKYLKEGGEQFDKDGAARRTMGDLRNQADLLAKDLERGGSQFANALREAQFNLRTVGFSPQGQRAAAINERAENEIRDLPLGVLNSAYRDQQIAAIRERQRLETETLRQQTVLGETQRSGLLNRVPENLRQYYVDAAAQTGVPLDFGLAVSYAESRFNPQARSTAPNSRATGLMQLQPGTAREMGVDINDPAQNVLGGFRYLRDRLRQANNDEALAYGLYHDGPASSGNSAAARAAYGVVQRFRNMPTTGQEVAAEDQRSRALEEEQKRVAISTQLLGVNGEAHDAASRKAQLLADAQARGIPITADVIAEAERFSSGMAAAARTLAGTQAGRTLEFERDQLGRDRYDQQAFARARSVYGDVTTPQALAYIDQSRQVSALTDAKATFSDVFGGMVTDLRRGADAASVATSALGRFADKLMSSVVDRIGSQLFGSIAGSAGSSGGGLLSLLGFAGGGVMTPFGAMPLRTYAAGGIANTPQMAIFGEGSMNEAYVPLPDGRRIPVAMQTPANTNAPSPIYQTTIINNAPVQVEKREVPDGRGGRRQEIVINETVAGAQGSPQVRQARALQRLASR